MQFDDNTLLVSQGIFYPSLLRDIKQGADPLQPFWEAFTNALEAITDSLDKVGKGKIVVKLYYQGGLLDGKKFDKLVVEDTGVGFNDIEFSRFLTYKDDRKGHNNRGSGRLQLVHAFSTCEYLSVFKKDDKFFERKFHLSGRPLYLKENAIAFLEHTKPSNGEITGTRLTMLNNKSTKLATAINIHIDNFKEQIITHYIQYFCLHRDVLPEIVLESYINNEKKDTRTIKDDDIPPIDNTKEIELFFKKYDSTSKKFVYTRNKEKFTLKSFKIPAYQLKVNALKLTSKDEVVENEDHQLAINVISPEDTINKNRFLFLVSSPFIDNRDQDTRGDLQIYKQDDFKKNAEMFNTEEIFIEDIEQAANEVIVTMYDEIGKKAEEKKGRVQELKKMFLLNEELLKKVTVTVNDTEERVLEKVYVLESRQMAKADASIKKQIDSLNELDPSAPNYQEKLTSLAENLVKEIPLQNRAALTHYVAKRKLVLDIYDKILNGQLTIQSKPGRKKSESLLHNTFFKQRSSDVSNSDLWIISEDFIYFKGTSEAILEKMTVDGVKLIKEQLTAEEQAFVTNLNLDKLGRRPDVLLFPQEGKCIIIEYKAPKTNVAEHLMEINNYATLILNFAKPEFKIDTFFGYLVGEAIDPDEVRSCDSDFRFSYQFDYLFRPAKSIFNKFTERPGALYTEVIKYSTLLERAKNRNNIFIEKLLNGIAFDSKSEDEQPTIL